MKELKYNSGIHHRPGNVIFLCEDLLFPEMGENIMLKQRPCQMVVETVGILLLKLPLRLT